MSNTDIPLQDERPFGDSHVRHSATHLGPCQACGLHPDTHDGGDDDYNDGASEQQINISELISDKTYKASSPH